MKYLKLIVLATLSLLIYAESGEALSLITSHQSAHKTSLRVTLPQEKRKPAQTQGTGSAQAQPQTDRRTEVTEDDYRRRLKPNPLLLLLHIDNKGKLRLNGEDAGTADDMTELRERLAKLFRTRTEQNVFKPGMETRTDLPLNERIEKTVYIRPGASVSRDETKRIIEVLEDAGANPVEVLSEERYNRLFPLNDNERLPPPVTERQNPKIISGGVLNGKAISKPQPVYPAVARAANASGTVVVQVTIDEEGNVISARAVSGHPLLQSAAVSAARQAKFTPTKLSGQPVKVTGVLSYNFVLQK